MRRRHRPLILRLIDAAFPDDPTIPPRRHKIAHKHRKDAKRRRIRERKPKEPKS